MNAEGGTPTRISDETHLNTSPAWTVDGDVLFISNLGGARDIYLQRLNRNLTPRGGPVRVTTGLNPHTISISSDGTQIYPGQPVGGEALEVEGRAGEAGEEPGQAEALRADAAFSPAS